VRSIIAIEPSAVSTSLHADPSDEGRLERADRVAPRWPHVAYTSGFWNRERPIAIPPPAVSSAPIAVVHEGINGTAGFNPKRKSVSLGGTVILRGWHYLPDRAGPTPTVVMAHGYSAVKEMYLDRFAEAFAEAGIGAVVFDNRNFGASDGEPRQEIDPWRQIRDYRDAITWASGLSEVDAERIGIWGSSYSGAHVLVVGAIDRRVKCIVAQVPLISGHANARRLIRADFIGQVQAACLEDRRARYQRKPPGMIPVVSEDPIGPAVLPTADSWQWFIETACTRAPAWRNEVTLRSVEMFLEYEPGAHITHISPTPLMMVALGDHLTVADGALAAYERALEPKRLVMLPGGDFDAYVQDFAASSGAACEWFREHLLVTKRL